MRSWRSKTRRDLKISSRISTRSWQDLKISAAKNSPRFWPRSQNLVKILAEISTRSQNLGGQRLAKNLDKNSSKILARSHSLGGQNLAENLVKTSSKISSRNQNLGGQKKSCRENWKFSWQCFQGILKCQYSGLGKLFINSLTEVVSNRQNKHTEIRLLTTC